MISKRKELFLVILISGLYVYGLLAITGTLTSGYHLLDDHEILINTAYFRDGTYTWKTIFSQGIFNYFQEGIRFRPLYTTLRLLRSWVFGTNYTAWSLLVGGEVVGCLISAYYVARNMGGGYFVSG